MKTCPICHAVAFDDASTCFGCMHRFEQEGSAGEGDALLPVSGGVQKPPAFQEASRSVEATASALGADVFETVQESASLTDAVPPAFFIKMVPTRQEGGVVSWACSVAMAGA